MRLLSSASKLLKCDLERVKNFPRVSEADRSKRAILLYFLWQDGPSLPRSMATGRFVRISFNATPMLPEFIDKILHKLEEPILIHNIGQFHFVN